MSHALSLLGSSSVSEAERDGQHPLPGNREADTVTLSGHGSFEHLESDKSATENRRVLLSLFFFFVFLQRFISLAAFAIGVILMHLPARSYLMQPGWYMPIPKFIQPLRSPEQVRVTRRRLRRKNLFLWD